MTTGTSGSDDLGASRTRRRAARRTLPTLLALFCAGGLLASSTVPAAAETVQADAERSSSTQASAPGASAGFQDRIINGQPAQIEDAPFIVALNVPDGYTGRPDGEDDNFCGGSLIAADKVLTAAHCLEGRPDSLFTLQIGSTDRLGGETAKIADTWIHPDYTSSAHDNDIAVITLDRGVSAPTADLGRPADNAPGTPATVLGWGTTETGAVVNDLRKVGVPLVSDEDCAEAYANYDSVSMLCAGYDAGGKDACQGDSGGPMIANGRVVGVVSFGQGCALEGYYGVYARVSSFEDEIAAQLN